MEIYKLSKFISISSDLATVEMISEKNSINVTLQRTKCFLNREYRMIARAKDSPRNACAYKVEEFFLIPRIFFRQCPKA